MALSRNELWRLQYRNKRYMEHISTDELLQRFKDVLSNQFIFHSDGMQIRSIEGKGSFWFVLLTHILEEFDHRGGFPDDPKLHGFCATKINNQVMAKAADIVNAMNIPDHGKYLVKLGKLLYMRDIYDNGRIRINPASFYSDPSLNSAQMDDELRFNFDIHPSYIKIKKQTGQEHSVPNIGKWQLNLRSSCDYYIFCMSQSVETRLYDDFDADCCLFIHRPEEFCLHLIDSCKKQFRQDIKWNGAAFSVRYVDPLDVKSSTT